MKLNCNPRAIEQWTKAHCGARDHHSGDWTLKLPTCPVCGDNKQRVYFNPTKQLGHCFRNGCNFDFSLLLRTTMGFQFLHQALAYIETEGLGGGVLVVPPDSTAMAVLRDSALSSLRGEITPQVATGLSVGMRTGFSVDFSTPDGGAVLAYARKRNLPDWFIRSGEYGYFSDRPWGGQTRAVLLVLEGSLVVFWMARAVYPGAKPKILYPAEAEFGYGQTQVVAGLNRLLPGEPALICEGYISALSAGPGGVATLGSRLSYTQARKIAARKPSEAILLREPDQSREHCMESVSRLTQFGIPASVADLVDGDANDNPAQVPEILLARQPYSPLSVLRARAQDAVLGTREK